MNRILQGAFIAGLICTAGLGRAAEAIPLSVRIYNYADVSEIVLAHSQVEAARIFRQAGIELTWLPCAGSDEEFAKSPDKFSACVQATGTAIVRIQPKSFGVSAVRSTSEIARAGEERAEVFYDRLQQSSNHQFAPELILAHVIAHELGHLLLGERSHTSDGIMAARFRAKELKQAQKGQLLFTPAQSQGMRHHVQR